ncbi:MAG: DUF1499 domain-containing protein [Planctomycetes bacterium]|nr:DUF1499 domain-containing protein [Planctomycetota bacterium]
MIWISITLAALVALSVLVLRVASRVSATAPELGLDEQGQLSPCPDKPNCVCSFDPSTRHDIKPFQVPKTKKLLLAFESACSFCEELPGSRKVTQDDTYARFEVRSRFFRFVDDVELLLDRDGHQIHFRSGSRVGHSDMGVNRRRVETIKDRLAEWAE